MNESKMKNMIVLKDLPSNIIDEAIVILKPNVKIENLNIVDSKKNSTDYIINEAQMVISNYIGAIEKQKETKYKTIKNDENRRKIVKTIAIVLGVVLFGKIALLM